MNKHDFVRKVAANTGFRIPDVSNVIDATVKELAEVMRSGDSMSFPGFGIFSGREVPVSRRRNPRTGEMVEVPAHLAPKVKISPVLKNSMRAASE